MHVVVDCGVSTHGRKTVTLTGGLETGSDRPFVRALELHEFVQSNNKGR